MQHNNASVQVAVHLGSVNLICAKKNESGKRNFVDTFNYQTQRPCQIISSDNNPQEINLLNQSMIMFCKN
jgi:hypothetical protein